MFLEVGSDEAFSFPDTVRQLFDLVFQDGMQAFDHVLLEFTYNIYRLMSAGGLAIYDVVDTYSINRFARYVLLYPHWEIVA